MVHHCRKAFDHLIIITFIAPSVIKEGVTIQQILLIKICFVEGSSDQVLLLGEDLSPKASIHLKQIFMFLLKIIYAFGELEEQLDYLIELTHFVFLVLHAVFDVGAVAIFFVGYFLQ